MNVNILDAIPVKMDAAALMRQAHVEPGSSDAADWLGLLARARRVARPKAFYREVFIEERGDGWVRLEGVTFTSRMLVLNLAGVDRVFPYVASCGRELDQAAPPREDFVQAYWWDLLKGALLMQAMGHLTEHLRRVFRLGRTARMNPGSGDADVWPIQQQTELFRLLGDGAARIGVELTPSFLMVPNKSVSGLLYTSEKDFRTCQVCRRKVCPNRGAPLDQAMWERLHGTAAEPTT